MRDDDCVVLKIQEAWPRSAWSKLARMGTAAVASPDEQEKRPNRSGEKAFKGRDVSQGPSLENGGSLSFAGKTGVGFLKGRQRPDYSISLSYAEHQSFRCRSNA